MGLAVFVGLLVFGAFLVYRSGAGGPRKKTAALIAKDNPFPDWGAPQINARAITWKREGLVMVASGVSGLAIHTELRMHPAEETGFFNFVNPPSSTAGELVWTGELIAKIDDYARDAYAALVGTAEEDACGEVFVTSRKGVVRVRVSVDISADEKRLRRFLLAAHPVIFSINQLPDQGVRPPSQ